MATIKEIAEAVGVSSAAVSRVLNYDTAISVSNETKEAIFETAKRLGYKKKVVYPKIDNVVLLYWMEDNEELEELYYGAIRKELVKQAKKMNISMKVINKAQGIESIPKDVEGFVAIGWFSKKELEKLYRICKKGVFVDSSPDEKHFDAVRPNLDSFVTQMVDYFVSHGNKNIGFIGGMDKNIETGAAVMDVREWSFRQSTQYYNCLNEDMILIADKYSVEEGYRLGIKLLELPTVPSAVCVASDTLAVGILQALNEKGVSIPERIEIFSINDINVAQYVSPPLTTFHIDIPIICESALDLLRGRIIKGTKVTKVVFVNGLPIYRKSCKINK